MKWLAALLIVAGLSVAFVPEPAPYDSPRSVVPFALWVLATIVFLIAPPAKPADRTEAVLELGFRTFVSVWAYAVVVAGLGYAIFELLPASERQLQAYAVAAGFVGGALCSPDLMKRFFLRLPFFLIVFGFVGGFVGVMALTGGSFYGGASTELAGWASVVAGFVVAGLFAWMVAAVPSLRGFAQHPRWEPANQIGEDQDPHIKAADEFAAGAAARCIHLGIMILVSGAMLQLRVVLELP
jgi:hypothetical protein